MRLVTRADLDGLTCAVLLREVEKIDSVEFAHPKDVQDGKVALTGDDILANLPYDKRAALWFDHHLSQADHAAPGAFKGAYSIAPSAARVIADHYRHPSFAGRYKKLIEETDRMDAALLDEDDVLEPKGWILLGYTLDPRTGLGAFREYFLHVAELCKTHEIHDILKDPQVKERVDRVLADEKVFLLHLHEVSKLDGNVVITDVRGRRDNPSGNRFLIYTIYPEANVSVRVADGKAGEFVSVQVGHSIFNRTCKTNVGELMAKYGGGGHMGAGTCQPAPEQADGVIGEIVATLKKNG